MEVWRGKDAKKGRCSSLACHNVLAVETKLWSIEAYQSISDLSCYSLVINCIFPYLKRVTRHRSISPLPQKRLAKTEKDIHDSSCHDLIYW